MRQSTLTFNQPARRVYTSVKNAVQSCGQFKKIVCNDQTFTITARHGMSLFSFGENITIHVVAIGTQETEVRIESKSRIFLNFINGGVNKKNGPEPRRLYSQQSLQALQRRRDKAEEVT